MTTIGLLGCGTVVHTNYAKTLIGREAYRVGYVCDTNAEQAGSAAAVFGAEVVDLDGLVERSDAIVISTPPSTHDALVRACLRPGRKVLCEKPFMTAAGDAAGAVTAAREADAQLYVGQFRRTFPQMELAHDLVRLGVIGDVVAISASEGGRFTWKAVSDYPVRDPNGGVLWDTGSHTLDMALFVANLDEFEDIAIGDIEVVRDKPEPSHDFRARFTLAVNDRPVEGHLHVSRKEVLPNLIRVKGTRGEVVIVTGMDTRVRLITETGTMVVHAERGYLDLLECFDLQLERIFTGRPSAAVFEGHRFIGQVRIMEALAHA